MEVASSSSSDEDPDPLQSPPPEPVFLPNNWKYRGEGGANLVICLPGLRTVARFAKSKYLDKDQASKIGEIAYFANEVMRPLLGPHFVRPVRIGMLVSERDLERVRAETQPLRPPHRRKKDINCRRVILSPDCVFLTPEYEENTSGDTFSVEIKPKQGWHSLKATCSVDLCHRCLKQYAKLYQGEIDCISEYCPLDLFSGDKVRMKRAVFDLFENPFNRFKLFKNGDLVYTNNVGSLQRMEEEMEEFLGSARSGRDLLAALLCTALLTPPEDSNSNSSNAASAASAAAPAAAAAAQSVMEEFLDLNPAEASSRRGSSVKACDTRSIPLPKNCVLQRLLTLQRHADISDREAKELCDKLLSNIDDIEGLHQLVLWHPNTKLEHQLSPSEIEDVLQLQRFLLSVTAKDVSILLTFRQVEEAKATAESTSRLPTFHFKAVNKYLRVMVSVIDLDPKSVHRISTWVKKKEEWYKSYFDSISFEQRLQN